MKRLIFFMAFALVSMVAGAQYRNTVDLYEKGNKTYRLDVSALTAVPMVAEWDICRANWDKADKLKTIGAYLTTVGGIGTMVAFPTMVATDFFDRRATIPALSVTGAVLLSGITVWTIGAVQHRNAAKRFVATMKSDYDGVGISLSF